MPQIRDWKSMNELSARLLKESTGFDVAEWMSRINKQSFADEKSLRSWLAQQGVSGYAQSLLVMEKFGYPDFMKSSADELVDCQYADRQELRPIYEAIVTAAAALGDVIIQTRKTYVSLVTTHRTFARVQPTTRKRVDLGLRLDGIKPSGRLVPSKIHETTPLQISFASLEEVDDEALGWLKKAYEQNS